MNANNLRLITPTTYYMTLTYSNMYCILFYAVLHIVSLLHTLYFSYRRMNYTDAIQYLKDNNITKDDGTFYEFGEVSYDS